VRVRVTSVNPRRSVNFDVLDDADVIARVLARTDAVAARERVVRLQAVGVELAPV